MGLTMSQQQAVTKTIGRRYRWTLLHRYGNLARFLRHLPNPPKANLRRSCPALVRHQGRKRGQPLIGACERPDLPRAVRRYSADDEAERVTCGVAVDPPRDWLTAGSRTRGGVLTLEGTARGHDPLVRGVEVVDKDVEVDQARPDWYLSSLRAIGAGLERQPLTMRWWFERHPAWVPLDGIAAQQTRPEGGQL